MRAAWIVFAALTLAAPGYAHVSGAWLERARPGLPLPLPPEPAAPSGREPGLFRMIIKPAAKKKNKRWEKALRESRYLEDNVAWLNARLTLPADLSYEARDCDEANAYYDPEEHAVVLCYDLLAETARLFRKNLRARSARELERTVTRLTLGDFLHTFYHETGHALIDLCDLPTTGREEDAADQLATVLLLAGDEEAQLAVETAAMEFSFSQDSGERRPFWDEHSFAGQRYYDTLCLIYGKDPLKNAGMLRAGMLPAARADGCDEEYRKYNDSWFRLLAPHLKKLP